MENIYAVGPDKAKKYLRICLESGVVPFIQGEPGCGKSAIVKQIAKEYQLELIDVRLSMLDQTDIHGLPHFENGKAIFSPFSIFPLENTPLSQGKEGFLLFLDEMNSAPRGVMAACYKLILDRMVGEYKLHPYCFIVCAGNRMEDKAIVNNIGTAMKSRLIHITLEPNFDDWLKNVAIPDDYDSRIIAYLNMYKNKLCDFDPERDEDTFACPRSWEFCNKIIKDRELDNNLVPLIVGTVGSGVAVEFVQFTKVFKDLPNLKEIFINPDAVDVPESAARKWAVISILLSKTDGSNIENVIKYINKFDLSFKILFYRSIFIKHKNFIDLPFVREAVSEMAQYFYE